MGNTGEGREGDWKCEGCGNRNYAFRSFCNRCKQPRLLMDSKTPPDSKWLPRIGDWICAGCSNNNYASREKCKKCGEPKEVAAMPATALPGASYQTPGHYFPRHSVGVGLGMNMGLPMPLPHQPLPLSSSWPFSGGDTNGLPSSVPNGSLLNSKSWRAGDWICVCGYHNYSSRALCKQCNAPVSSVTPVSTTNSAVSAAFPGLGTKRLASDEFSNDWASKRLNVGGDLTGQYLNQQPLQYGGLEERGGFLVDQPPGLNLGIPSGSLSIPNFHMQTPLQPPLTTLPTLLGKGAKQWRSGDWMCTSCSNHNFASREQCNRCNAKKEASTQLVPVS
eukprot:Gb_05871 [translate_table: standard]